MRHTHGSIEVVCGSMFSGKTDELIRRLIRATIARQNVQVFKPAIDVRYAVEKVTSHAGSNFEATPVEKSIDILENKCQNLKDIISVKNKKIIALVDQILSKMKHNDVTIEPEIYSSTYERKLWAKRHSESEYNIKIRKKYTFHP